MSCIGIALINSVNVSNANIEENYRAEFELNSPAGHKGAEHLVYDAVFDSNYFLKESTEFNKELADLSIRMAMAASVTAES